MNREPQQIFEELLVLQSQGGDSDSIAELVKTWHPRLIRYAMKIVGEREAAIDAVQDSWIAIWKGLKKVDDPAKFRSWAFQIVHNKSYDAIRGNIKRRKAIDVVSQLAASSSQSSNNVDADQGNQNDAHDRLIFAIRKLQPEDQVILELYYREDLSLKEIEVVTGATVSAIKSRLDRLRRKLKTILKGTNDGK